MVCKAPTGGADLVCSFRRNPLLKSRKDKMRANVGRLKHFSIEVKIVAI